MAINVLRRLPGDAEQPIITQTLLLNKVGTPDGRATWLKAGVA